MVRTTELAFSRSGVKSGSTQIVSRPEVSDSSGFVIGFSGLGAVDVVAVELGDRGSATAILEPGNDA